MDFGFATFRSWLISLGLICFVLFGGASAADGNTTAKAPAQVAILNLPFTLRVGRQVTLQGGKLRLKFVAVKEDSRCPQDVECVWAGNATVRLEVSVRGKGNQTLTLNTNGNPTLVQEREYRGYKVKLIGLAPYPRSTRSIAAGDYVVTLLVSKNGA